MNEEYYSNSTNLRNINRKKKRSENFEREPAGMKGERRRRKEKREIEMSWRK
jgi:hypothetical protein